MRITDGSSNARIEKRHDVDSAHPPALAERSAMAASQGVSDSSGASELARLVAAVKATDEVRLDSIRDASRRLAAGAYATADAAERTAHAILQATD